MQRADVLIIQKSVEVHLLRDAYIIELYEYKPGEM
jgi:hypothetical protein